MATAKHEGFLGAVYESKGKADMESLYDRWAETYDAEMARNGYRHPTVCLALLARHVPRGSAPILDAGCGTGLLGEWLPIVGYPRVEALDLSEGMLAVARKKNCYAALHQLALGGPLPFADGHFAAVVASGVFSLGHVGADGLDELIRSTRKGGPVIFTVKNALWEQGFGDAVMALVKGGRVTVVEETPPYVSMPGEAATTPSHAVVLKVA